MLRNKKYGRARGRGAHRIPPCRVLPILLALILLIPVHGISAADQITSGTVKLSNALNYGSTAYSIDYSYPSTAEVGTNLTIAVTLHVNSLNGLVEYVYDYRLDVDVYIGANVLNGSVTADAIPLSLYPGSTWGPKDVTIPLTADNTGLAKGASANATVTIRLGDTIWVGGQYLAAYHTEPPMQGAAGGFAIQNVVASTSSSTTGQGTIQTYFPYVLIATGAVLILLMVALLRRPLSPQASQK